MHIFWYIDVYTDNRWKIIKNTDQFLIVYVMCLNKINKSGMTILCFEVFIVQ